MLWKQSGYAVSATLAVILFVNRRSLCTMRQTLDLFPMSGRVVWMEFLKKCTAKVQALRVSLRRKNAQIVKSEAFLYFPLVLPSDKIVHRSAETWPSGRRRSPAKGVGPEGSRGFESLRLRHLPSRKRSPHPASTGFFRCFRGLCGLG